MIDLREPRLIQETILRDPCETFLTLKRKTKETTTFVVDIINLDIRED